MDTNIKILRDILAKTVENIDVGNCNATDEEIATAIESLNALNQNVYNITKRYACDRILHCAPSTFELYRTMGLIPEGKHDYGSNEVRWRKSDFDDALKYRRKHTDK